MKLIKYKIFMMAFVFIVLATVQGYSQGQGILETDTTDRQLIAFFDLRDRESFMQITNTDTAAQSIHIQVFNVNDNCNENNFFDVYTPNDTHTYNLRDILTNDGNPSGVVLPDNAYGVFVATFLDVNDTTPPFAMIGNLRVLDNNGYEYRTNMIGPASLRQQIIFDPVTFNFNSTAGISLSDVVGFSLSNVNKFIFPAEVFAADLLNIYMSFDVDILDNSENIFSCRNVTFACVNDQNPLLESLLAESGTSVASFEYGINNALPHSKGGELLCPGNNISEGVVTLNNISLGEDSFFSFYIFVGLNNGNSRGSIDTVFNAQTLPSSS